MATLQGTLTLTRAVLSEVVSNPNTVPRSVVAGTAGSIQGAGGGTTKMEGTSQDGAFRKYGGGNTRLVLGSTTQRTQTLALIALAPTQVATVKALLGHTVCYRDPYGKKLIGSFLDMQESVVPHSGTPEAGTMLTNVGIVLTQITYNEAV